MTRAISALACLGALVSGCYQQHTGDDVPVVPGRDAGSRDAGDVPPPPPPPPPLRDGGPLPELRWDAGDEPTEPPPPPPMGSTYVISWLSLPENTGMRAPGANLDGRDSGEGSTSPTAACDEFSQDFVSPADGTRGVDNMYSTLVPTAEGVLDESIDGSIEEAIVGGVLLLVIELDGGRIGVHLAAPVGDLRARGGRLRAGNTVQLLWTLGTGRVRTSGGRAIASIDRFSGRIPPESIPLIPFGFLQQVEMRFDVADGALSNGEIGGWFTVDDAVAEFSKIMPGIEDTVRSVIESVADISPSRADPFICDAISLGVSFEAVPVNVRL